MNDFPWYGVAVEPAVVDQVEACVYSRDSHYLSPWQEDPLISDVDKAAREALFQNYQVTTQGRTLVNDYIALRQISRELAITAEG